jgi:hypothetical protein
MVGKQETGFEEIGVTESLVLEADFRPASLRVHPGQYFRVARYPGTIAKNDSVDLLSG